MTLASNFGTPQDVMTNMRRNMSVDEDVIDSIEKVWVDSIVQHELSGAELNPNQPDSAASLRRTAWESAVHHVQTGTDLPYVAPTYVIERNGKYRRELSSIVSAEPTTNMSTLEGGYELGMGMGMDMSIPGMASSGIGAPMGVGMGLGIGNPQAMHNLSQPPAQPYSSNGDSDSGITAATMKRPLDSDSHITSREKLVRLNDGTSASTSASGSATESTTTSTSTSATSITAASANSTSTSANQTNEDDEEDEFEDVTGATTEGNKGNKSNVEIDPATGEPLKESKRLCREAQALIARTAQEQPGGAGWEDFELVTSEDDELIGDPNQTFHAGMALYDEVKRMKKAKSTWGRWSVRFSHGLVRLDWEDIIFHKADGHLQW